MLASASIELLLRSIYITFTMQCNTEQVCFAFDAPGTAPDSPYLFLCAKSTSAQYLDAPGRSMLFTSSYICTNAINAISMCATIRIVDVYLAKR